MSDQAKMPEWVKVWGPVAVILGVMWAITGRLEDRLMARIDGLEEKVDQNTAVIVENGKAIARLEVRVEQVEVGLERLRARIQGVEGDVTWLRNNHRGDR